MLNATLLAPASGDDRGSVRLRLLVDASYVTGSDAPTDLAVRDLSTTGFLFETDTGFAPRSMIRLNLPAVGVRDAKIVWSGGRYRGAEFLQPISRSSVQAVYGLSKVVWPSFPSGQAGATGDRTAIEAVPAADAFGEAARPALPSGLKILFVAALAVLLWAAIAFTARIFMT